jgi:hypothetical protein
MASTLHTQNESTTVALGLSELGKELSSIDAPLAAFTKARRNHYRGSIGAASFGYRDALAKLEAVGTGSAVIPELGSQVKLHYAELLMSDAVLDTSQAKQLLSRSPARRSSPYVQVSRLSLGARLLEVRGQADSANGQWLATLSAIEEASSGWLLPDVRNGVAEVAVPQLVVDAPLRAARVFLQNDKDSQGATLEAAIAGLRNTTFRNEPGALALLHYFRLDYANELHRALLETVPTLSVAQLQSAVSVTFRVPRKAPITRQVPFGRLTLPGILERISAVLCKLPSGGAQPSAPIAAECEGVDALSGLGLPETMGFLSRLLLPDSIRQEMLKLTRGTPIFVHTTPPFHSVPFGALWLDDGGRTRLGDYVTPVLITAPARGPDSGDLAAFRYVRGDQATVFMNERSSQPIFRGIPSQPTLNIFFNAQPALGERARRHASSVGEILKASIVSGETATSVRLQKALLSSRITHVIAHGIWNNNLGGGVIVTQSERQPQFDVDGGLTGLDIIASRVSNGALVTLSSCESAVAHPQDPMNMSLGAAIIEAGAAAVVGTLWKVSETQAAAFMEEFHRQLTSDSANNEARAFFEAQRRVRGGAGVATEAFVLLRGFPGVN